MTTTLEPVGAARRRLFGLLPAVLHDDAAPAMRRPGKDAMVDASLPDEPAALPTPPATVRWLQKATFGFSAQAHAELLAMPGASEAQKWQAWVDWQLAPAGIDDGACDARIAAAGFTTLGKTLPQLWADHRGTANYGVRMLPIEEAECATIIRTIHSRRQLHEVVTDFWHDHFSVFGWDYDGGPVFVHYDRDVIRPNALGNFRTLLEAVCRSTTMMYALDLYESTRDGPNENYARELLELHTLGAENYAGVLPPDHPSLPSGTDAAGQNVRLKYVDNDVYEATRALTGWTLKNGHWQFPGENDGTFTFRNGWHDWFNKYILNRYFAANQSDGQQDGFRLFDILAAHPGTAGFIARKLCTRLIGEGPSAAIVESAAQVFMTHWQAPDQLAQVVRHILVSDEFRNTWGSKVKRPFVAAVSAMRAIGADFVPTPQDYPNEWSTKDEFNHRVQQAGHRLFYWPAPNGYPDRNSAWRSTGALAMTWKLLARLTEIHREVGYDGDRPFLADIYGQTQSTIAGGVASTPAGVVGFWCDRIFGFRPSGTYELAVDFLRQNAAADAVLDFTTDNWRFGSNPDFANHYNRQRLRTTVALLLCSPDFFQR
jgi:uncharacterized protein (DUF1800 family)